MGGATGGRKDGAGGKKGSGRRGGGCCSGTVLSSTCTTAAPRYSFSACSVQPGGRFPTYLRQKKGHVVPMGEASQSVRSPCAQRQAAWGGGRTARASSWSSGRRCRRRPSHQACRPALRVRPCPPSPRVLQTWVRPPSCRPSYRRAPASLARQPRCSGQASRSQSCAAACDRQMHSACADALRAGTRGRAGTGRGAGLGGAGLTGCCSCCCLGCDAGASCRGRGSCCGAVGHGCGFGAVGHGCGCARGASRRRRARSDRAARGSAAPCYQGKRHPALLQARAWRVVSWVVPPPAPPPTLFS